MSCVLTLFPSPGEASEQGLDRQGTEGEEEEEEEGVLDRHRCRAALASLRHAKWFQVCHLCRPFRFNCAQSFSFFLAFLVSIACVSKDVRSAKPVVSFV